MSIHLDESSSGRTLKHVYRFTNLTSELTSDRLKSDATDGDRIPPPPPGAKAPQRNEVSMEQEEVVKAFSYLFPASAEENRSKIKYAETNRDIETAVLMTYLERNQSGTETSEAPIKQKDVMKYLTGYVPSTVQKQYAADECKKYGLTACFGKDKLSTFGRKVMTFTIVRFVDNFCLSHDFEMEYPDEWFRFADTMEKEYKPLLDNLVAAFGYETTSVIVDIVIDYIMYMSKEKSYMSALYDECSVPEFPLEFHGYILGQCVKSWFLSGCSYDFKETCCESLCDIFKMDQYMTDELSASSTNADSKNTSKTEVYFNTQFNEAAESIKEYSERTRNMAPVAPSEKMNDIIAKSFPKSMNKTRAKNMAAVETTVFMLLIKYRPSEITTTMIAEKSGLSRKAVKEIYGAENFAKSKIAKSESRWFGYNGQSVVRNVFDMHMERYINKAIEISGIKLDLPHEWMNLFGIIYGHTMGHLNSVFNMKEYDFFTRCTKVLIAYILDIVIGKFEDKPTKYGQIVHEFYHPAFGVQFNQAMIYVALTLWGMYYRTVSFISFYYKILKDMNRMLNFDCWYITDNESQFFDIATIKEKGQKYMDMDTIIATRQVAAPL